MIDKIIKLNPKYRLKETFILDIVMSYDIFDRLNATMIYTFHRRNDTGLHNLTFSNLIEQNERSIQNSACHTEEDIHRKYSFLSFKFLELLYQFE